MLRPGVGKGQLLARACRWPVAAGADLPTPRGHHGSFRSISFLGPHSCWVRETSPHVPDLKTGLRGMVCLGHPGLEGEEVGQVAVCLTGLEKDPGFTLWKLGVSCGEIPLT